MPALLLRAVELFFRISLFRCITGVSANGNAILVGPFGSSTLDSSDFGASGRASSTGAGAGAGAGALASFSGAFVFVVLLFDFDFGSARSRTSALSPDNRPDRRRGKSSSCCA